MGYLIRFTMLLIVWIFLIACGGQQKTTSEKKLERCEGSPLVKILSGQYLIGCGVTRVCYAKDGLRTAKILRFEVERLEAGK